MDNHEKHAWAEFKAAGWIDETGKFNDETQNDICMHVMDLLKVFSAEGHSGSSAPYAVDLFKKLALFEPITPLTGEDWEFTEIVEGVFQNTRAMHVFKQKDRFDGQAYDVNGKVFWEWFTDENDIQRKVFYTCSESAVPVTFPYTPKSEYFYRESEA